MFAYFRFYDSNFMHFLYFVYRVDISNGEYLMCWNGRSIDEKNAVSCMLPNFLDIKETDVYIKNFDVFACFFLTLCSSNERNLKWHVVFVISLFELQTDKKWGLIWNLSIL